MKQWTKKQAREYLVKYHMINTDDNLLGKDGVHKVFDRIQSIQVDSLDVVGRNVDIVLQARVKDYKKLAIEELLYQDRTIVDGWDKMMSIYKTEDFPKFSYVRKYRAESEIYTLKNRVQIDALEFLEDIISLIDDGPKYSREISMGGKSNHHWGQMKVSSAALDYLFFRGDILVRQRKNHQKQYDLSYKLIGDIATKESPFKTEEDFIEYYLLRRIKACGLFSNRSGVHSSGVFISKKARRTTYIKKLLEKNLIEEVMIEGFKETLYIPYNADQMTSIIKETISFIAPLDNIVWDRDLVHNLFDFHYRWEVYTPISKREYGYYVLPILFKSEMIGRIEFKKHRNDDTLEIINTWFEPHVKKTEKLESKMNSAINRFEKYLKF